MKRYLAAIFSMFLLCFLNACGGGSNAGGGGGSHAATHFALTAPAAATAGTPITLTVVALDSLNQTATGYSGTVHLTSSDPQAVLSGDSTLTNGTKDFSETFGTAGNQTISATDTVSSAIAGDSSPIQVAADPNLHSFRPTGDMGTVRKDHTATLLPDGKVLVAGGFDGSAFLASAEIFDPVAGTFTATGTMLAARSSFSAVLLAHGPTATNGKVLVAGGDEGGTAELFDPATGSFKAVGATIQVISDSKAVLLNNGKVLFVGGFGSTAEEFDPSTMTFAATAGRRTSRGGPTATLLNDGKVLLTGGYNEIDTLGTAELFDPATGTFTATGDLITARSGHTATLLNNGKVLVAGGSDDINQPLTSAELFDPVTGSFSPTSSMASDHALHTATALDDGTVLIAGGSGSSIGTGDSSKVAELFDPLTNKFTPAVSMGTGRDSHTATLLNNGGVLVTGGESQNNPVLVLKSAEVYK